jgi:hypothetical protein
MRLLWYRWSDDTWCRKAIQTHFLHFGNSRKGFVRIPRDVVLSRRMDVRTHNLPTGRLKRRLCWSRWCDISRCRKAIRTHFLLSANHKNRLEWRPLSDVLSGQMALRTHNLPSEWLKIRLWWCRWIDVSRCQKPIRKHFPHSWYSKKRLRRCRGIYLCSRMSLINNNHPLGRLKKRLWWSRWNEVSRCRKAYDHIFCFLSFETNDTDEVG